VPVLSQEPKPVDPEVYQEIKALLMKFDEAFNKRDTAAIAALYTKEAVQVLDEWEGGGPISGHQSIEKLYTSEFALTPAEFVSKLVQVSPLAGELAVNSEFTCQPGRSAWNTPFYR
jgi:ketosteroid isomerase-like protein